jgi:hypothetical protein
MKIVSHSVFPQSTGRGGSDSPLCMTYNYSYELDGPHVDNLGGNLCVRVSVLDGRIFR